MSSLLPLAKTLQRFPYAIAPRRSFATALALILGWQARATDRWRLRQLDDHMLQDMGLTRDEALGQAPKRSRCR